MKKFLVSLLLVLVPLTALAAEEGYVDKAPINLNDYASIQRGAKVFSNYCLSCHSANYVRYETLEQVGLTADQIKGNLMFAADKVGSRMTIAMRPADAKKWFGITPPDLSVEARSRTPDWIYTYLRSFYRDDTRPSGWNNTALPNAAMPSVLWTLQGEQTLKNPVKEDEKPDFVLAHAGKLSPAEYNATVGDLVNYITWMAEPGKMKRMEIGVYVLLFLGLFFVLTFYLKKEFWKDIH
ncbi:MAG: cytochrome c1 [Betaproteobacteria bacterium]|nr:cytochrome c1 [Betaproteobacteria bacterium]